MIFEVPRRAEVLAVPGTEQHRAATHVDAAEQVQTSLPAGCVDADPRYAGHAFERQPDEVVTVGESVERHVEVRPGVRAHRDHADVERDARSIDRLGRIAIEMRADLRRRQPRIRGESLTDRMTEVDEAAAHGAGSDHRAGTMARIGG